MDNPEKLFTQYEEKQNIICVEHHYAQKIQSKQIRHEPSYKQLEVKTN